MTYSSTHQKHETTQTNNGFAGPNAQRKMAAVPVLQKVEEGVGSTQSKYVRQLQTNNPYGSYKDVEKNDAHHTPSALSLGCIVMEKWNDGKEMSELSPIISDWLPSSIYNSASAIHLPTDVHKETASYGGRNKGRVMSIIHEGKKKTTLELMNEIVKDERTTDERLVRKIYESDIPYDACANNDIEVSKSIDNFIADLKPPTKRFRNWSNEENEQFKSIVDYVRKENKKMPARQLFVIISNQLVKARTLNEIRNHYQFLCSKNNKTGIMDELK